MDYPLLRRTLAAWRKQPQQSSQNAGLIFDRFAPDWRNDQNAKKNGLLAVKDAAERADKDLLSAWQTRWQRTAVAVQAEPFTLRTDWRLIAGFGRKGPLEVGFTFHRYGFPILPGSSLKGLARVWGLLQIAEEWQMDDLKGLDDVLSEEDEDYQNTLQARFAHLEKKGLRDAAAFREIFGTPANAGQAVFLDAIPAELPELELDIMNPHFPRYYQDKDKGADAPTDSQNPIPVYFLTVAAGTALQFAVGWRGLLDKHAENYRSTAQNWLMQGLLNLGVGAKTSAGYGYFVAPAPTAPAAASVRTETVLSPPPTAAEPSAAPPPTVAESAAVRLMRRGRVRYEQGRASIHDVDDPQLRTRIDWKKLGMDNLPDRTMVEYVLEETAEGRRTVVTVRKAS